MPISDNAVSDCHIWLNNRPKDLDLLPNLNEVIIRGKYEAPF
nr:hypothetical protein [uncultured Haemophilus sp.]